MRGAPLPSFRPRLLFMRRLALLLASVVVVIPATARAAPDAVPGARTAAAPTLRLELRPEIGISGGTETYELSARNIGFAVGSKLTYPVDVPLAGGRATASYGAFAVALSFHTGLGQPSGTMVDSDYVGTTEFSHTESRVTAKLWSAELAGRMRVAELAETAGALPLSLVLGFRHAANAWDVHGASGWQGLTRRVSVSIPDGVHALHYTSTYEIAFFGARLDGHLGESVRLSSEARLLSAWSQHEDDHLIRAKRGTASVHALGWSLSGEIAWTLAGPLFLGAYGEVQMLSGSDLLKQRFYADDPGTPDSVEGPGTSIPDTLFSYRSDRWMALGFVGVAF